MMIVPKYYENLKVLHENTMPDRSYYMMKKCSVEEHRGLLKQQQIRTV